MGLGRAAHAHPLDAQDAPTSRRGGGFPLVAAGAVSGMIGVAAVLFAQGAPGMQRYVYREVAGVALGLALPLFLTGAAAVLPMGKLPRTLGMAGSGMTLLALAAFSWLYPTHWNVAGRDYSPGPILAYGTGLALLVASVTSGLLRAYLEMRQRRQEADGGDEVTDEEVMRDLLETTGRSKLTWGGVRTDERSIELVAPLMDSPLQGNIHKLGKAAKLTAENLTRDVDALLGFRGVRRSAREEYDPGPAQALARLRQERQAAAPRTLWQRVVHWWSGA